jgi:flagellar motor switch protein FliG
VLLAGERPQTIALVLSHLPPKQAGSLLARLAPALQVDVVRRLVDLEETSPEILQEVERALESRFSEQMLTQRRRVAGLSAVAGILEASESPVGAQILSNLAARDDRLAERLSPPRLAFADVVRLDRSTLGTIFRAAGPPLTILALVGAPEELIDRVLVGFSPAEANLIRDRLLHLGPTRLSDVEEARRRVAELAQRLAMEGRIELPRKPR